MKYLIMEDFSGKPVPFIFPRRVDHMDMREQLPYAKVLAAGFVEMHDGTLHCHGSHPELQANAREEDIQIINEALRAR